MNNLSFAVRQYNTLGGVPSSREQDGTGASSSAILSGGAGQYSSVVPGLVRYPDNLVPVVWEHTHLFSFDDSELFDKDLWLSDQVGTIDLHKGKTRWLMKAGACNSKPGKHKPLLVPENCGVRTCRDHWHIWAKRAGKRTLESLNGYLTRNYGRAQRALPGMSREKKLPRHVSFHPPVSVIRDIQSYVQKKTKTPEEARKLFWKQFNKESNRIIALAGVRGGTRIPHEIRLNSDRDVAECDRRADEGAVQRYRAVLDRDDWKDYVKVYPHQHVLAYGFLVDAATFHELSGGWTYRVHKTVETPESLVYYLLSHAPAIPGVDTVAHIGETNSQHQVKVKQYMWKEAVVCEECIEEGKPKEEAGRVVAVLDMLRCEHDGDPHARRKAGNRGKPIDWSFELITEKRFTQVIDYRNVYRTRAPSERRYQSGRKKGIARMRIPKERRRPEYVTEHIWKERIADCVIPGNWFDEEECGIAPGVGTRDRDDEHDRPGDYVDPVARASAASAASRNLAELREAWNRNKTRIPGVAKVPKALDARRASKD